MLLLRAARLRLADPHSDCALVEIGLVALSYSLSQR